MRRGAAPIGAAIVAVLAAALLHFVPGLRGTPTPRVDPPPSVGTVAPAAGNVAVEAELDGIVERYRKIIVLLADDDADEVVRERAFVAGQLLFHQNRERISSLSQRLVSELQSAGTATAGTPPAGVRTFLDRIERHEDYRDADRLVAQEILTDLADWLRGAKLEPAVVKPLRDRVDANLDALRRIQALYEKELEKVFGQLGTRGIEVKRESWTSYLEHLKGRFSREEILKAFEPYLSSYSDVRGAGPKKDSDVETYGMELPPKTVVLTFDDGPHGRYTDRILATLKQYGASAVFFQVGRNVGTVGENNTVKLGPGAEVSRRILDAGSVLANHSFTHAFLPKLTEVQYAGEIDGTDRLLKAVSETATPLFRPPYGARNQQILTALETRKLRSVMWNIDSRDWADPIPKSIAQRVLESVAKESRGIILFHDIHERTVEALPMVLEELRSQGYRFAAWDGKGFVVNRAAGAAEPVAAARTEVPPYRQSWAVIIGIDEYAKWPKLRHAVNDAKGVRDLLVKRFQFKPENVFTLLNGEATRQNILQLLGDKLGNPDLVKRDDRVFVFFAGHGATRKLSSGRDLGYIVPVEADLANFQGQAISMSNFQDIAEAIPAKHVLFVMDSCYSGLALTRAGGAAPSANYLRDIAKRTARQMLTAGGADQQVADTGPNGHSVFTWTLLQALQGKGDLNGDGYITATELASYAGPVVSSLSRQTPAFGSMPGSEGGEFFFQLAYENEFLSAQSAQLDGEAIRLNSEIEKLRAEIEDKRARNARLALELAAMRDAAKQPEAPAAPPPVPIAPSRMAQLRNDRGTQYFKEKRYDEALEEFISASKLVPNFALALNNAGFTYFRLGKHDEAARWLERAITADPRRAIAYLNLGDAYFELQRKPEARKAYEAYIEMQPTARASDYARERLEALR